MTRDVDPKKASGYITKATSSLEMAKLALQKEAYDSAVMNAVHSSINALDALTTYFLGKRASGSHTDVLLLTKGIFSAQEQSDVEKQYKSLIGLKNTSEYQPDLMSRKQAEGSIRSAERILAKVKTKIQV